MYVVKDVEFWQFASEYDEFYKMQTYNSVTRYVPLNLSFRGKNAVFSILVFDSPGTETKKSGNDSDSSNGMGSFLKFKLYLSNFLTLFMQNFINGTIHL